MPMDSLPADTVFSRTPFRFHSGLRKTSAALCYGFLLCSGFAQAPRPQPSLPLATKAGEKTPVPAVSTASQFKRASAKIGAPLFLSKPTGNLPAGNVQLTATELAPNQGAADGGPIQLTQNLSLGTRAGLDALLQHLRTLHKDWKPQARCQIAFSDTLAPDETVAFDFPIAILLTSMLGDWSVAPGCAAFGILRPDGTVFPVSRALIRVTAAARGGAKRILVPERNGGQVADMLLNDGPAAFCGVQIFAVNNFEDAQLYAAAEPTPEIAEALSRFEAIQQRLTAPGADPEALLKDPDTLEALRGVLLKSPNHLSARLLLGHSTGRYKIFSADGSSEVIERIGASLVPACRSPRPNDAASLQKDLVNKEVETLKKARERLDPTSQPWLDAVLRYAAVVQGWHQEPPRDSARAMQINAQLLATAKAARAEDIKLHNLLAEKRLNRR
jgi:hypothetical protein